MLIQVLQNNWQDFGGKVTIKITKKDFSSRTYTLISSAAFSSTKTEFLKLVRIAERNGGAFLPKKNIRAIALKLWQQTSNRYCLKGYDSTIV